MPKEHTTHVWEVSPIYYDCGERLRNILQWHCWHAEDNTNKRINWCRLNLHSSKDHRWRRVYYGQDWDFGSKLHCHSNCCSAILVSFNWVPFLWTWDNDATYIHVTMHFLKSVSRKMWSMQENAGGAMMKVVVILIQVSIFRRISLIQVTVVKSWTNMFIVRHQTWTTCALRVIVNNFSSRRWRRVKRPPPTGMYLRNLQITKELDIFYSSFLLEAKAMCLVTRWVLKHVKVKTSKLK